jgi:hypothetical protein
MAGLGVSFLPGSQDMQSGAAGAMGGRPGAPRNPIQEAVKILSLRLPKVFGRQALAPAPLLQAPGGMGQPGAKGNVTAQALAGLAGLPPSMAMPQMPAPMLGGGTDTTHGWANQERGLNGREPSGWPAPAPSSAPAPFLPPTRDLPPRIIPGGQDPVSGGSPLTPVGPEPEPFTPAWTPAPEPPAPQSPWEQPGRNQALARKYLEEMFGSQY